MNKEGVVYKLIEKEIRERTGSLDFSSLRFATIPDEISEFTWLHTLYLKRNQINDIHFLEKLVNLKSLDLKENQIGDISCLENLVNLQSLDLGSNKVTDYSILEKLCNLQYLNLSYNKIRDIRFLNKLGNLHTLDLSYNQISNIRFLEKLINLKSLDLRSNIISDIRILEKLNNLQFLNLGSNQISDIRFLEKLNNLQYLYLRSNKISDITHLKSLIINKGLNISWEDYSDGIAIKDNPLIKPPIEIVKRGREAIVDYLLKLEKDKIKLFESKMLIVGQGAVGKTCLLNRLITGKTQTKVDTTEGIDIKQWHFDTDEIKDFRINLWDFGGQEIYHATHQFFLSKRSLYLFVWDARKEHDIITSFDYWLNVISLLSDNAPIIVVMNKCDERAKAIEEETLKNKFKNIVGFHKVSALVGTGIEYLKADIQRHILSLPLVGNTLPKVWNDIRKDLEDLAKGGKNCIENRDYKAICARYELNATEADFISDYYHDIGMFLHFRDNIVLNDIVFLNPEWATNAVYRIIDTKKVVDAAGKFHFNELKTIWNEFEEDKFKYLIALMKRFELCFELGDSGNYIVPELLKPEFTTLDWDYNNNLRFEYNYTFMPAGIITRFITRKHNLIKDEIYWRHGIVLIKNSTVALVISEPLNRKIRIWLKGNEAREMLFMIKDEIGNIHETLNYPEVKEMYPCICDECKKSDNPYFFPSDTLVKFRLRNKTTAECQQSGIQVNIEELRGAIMSKSDIALETIKEIGAKSEGKFTEIIGLLETISSNQPGKESAIDAFFKIVPLNAGGISWGELLRRALKYKGKWFV
jgi:small GTP-binding protein